MRNLLTPQDPQVRQAAPPSEVYELFEVRGVRPRVVFVVALRRGPIASLAGRGAVETGSAAIACVHSGDEARGPVGGVGGNFVLVPAGKCAVVSLAMAGP